MGRIKYLLKKATDFSRYIYKEYKYKIFLLFLFCLFLIKATPFYYLPGGSKLVSSHTLAKLVVLGLLVIVFLAKTKEFKSLVDLRNLLFKLIAFFFVTQSVSVLASTDALFFWRSYHNLIVAFSIFFLSYFFASRKENLKVINRFIILSGILLLTYEFLFFLFPDLVLPVLRSIVQKEVLDAYFTNISRARYSLDMNVELFLPFFLVWAFYPVAKRKSLLQIVLILGSFVVLYLSLISNFRSRALMSFIGFSGFIFTYLLGTTKIKALNLKKFFLISLVFIVPVYISIVTSNRLFSFNVFDRFFLQDKREDIETINFRFKAVENSTEMFLSSPLVGVGLGNYAVFSEKGHFALQRFLYLDKYREDYAKRVNLSPHNVIFQVLSETGIFGIVSFLSLMVYFAIQDIKFVFKRKLSLINSYILAFWVTVVFMLFNPASTIFMIGWFWFIRGVIEAVYKKGLSLNSL
jgi:O-antigen ligase